MATTTSGLLDAVETTLATVAGVAKVARVPQLDMAAFARIPRTPAALVIPGDTDLDPVEGVFASGEFTVALIDDWPRDNLGERTETELEKVGEALIVALDYSQTDAIYVSVTKERRSVIDDVGTAKRFVVKEYDFEYLMARAAVSDVYAAPASVVLNPTGTYASGGTDLGRLLDVTIASWAGDFELLDKMPTGTLWTDARFHGVNMVLRCTFAQRSDAIMGMMFGLLASGGNVKSLGTQLLGHRVTSADMLNGLLIRPDDATQDHLFFPRALVTEIGPALYGRRARLMSAMTVTFAALYDSTAGNAWYHGATSSFPAL